MKQILHNLMEIKYDTFEELKEDIDCLKKQGFYIIDGYKNYAGEWRLNVVYTHKDSINRVITPYGKNAKYEIREGIRNIVLTGEN